jgi:hypothetical protein
MLIAVIGLWKDIALRVCACFLRVSTFQGSIFALVISTLIANAHKVVHTTLFYVYAYRFKFSESLFIGWQVKVIVGSSRIPIQALS